MSALSKIKIKGGILKVYEKSIIYENKVLFFNRKTSEIMPLIENIVKLMNSAYDKGVKDSKKEINEKFNQFLSSFSEE